MYETNKLSSAGIIYPNDYTLIKLDLITSVTVFDVKNILTELSYNEDLFNNTASGYLMVLDSTGFIEKLQMNGNEYIRFSFGKGDSTTNIVDKIFRIFKVAKRKALNEGNTESYSLYFCSEELLLSEQYKVSKSYNGQDITSMIEDILVNYLKVPNNKLNMTNMENSFGIYDFIVPNLKPFDAINWLSSYARPKNNPGADMLLFENKFGYNFKSIQSLYETPVYNEYNFDPKNLNGDVQGIQRKIYNVSSYEIMDSFDSLGAINSGIFANQLISVDPLLQRFKITDFDYYSYANRSTLLNENFITNDLKNRFGDKLYETNQASLKLVLSNYNQSDSETVKQNSEAVGRDIFAETYIPYRTAQLPLSTYTRVKISVPGDPALTVGRVIKFNLLSKDPVDKEYDAFYSGNYLITAVRHLLTVHEYKTVLEIAKESTVDAYTSAKNNTNVWNDSVKGIL
jgi:hypothetical protein